VRLTQLRYPGLLPLRARSRASNAPTAFGQNQKRGPRRASASASAFDFASAGGVGVGSPTIGCAAVVNPANAVCLTQPRGLVLLPLRARSRASNAPTACGQNQKRGPRRASASASAEGVGVPGWRSTLPMIGPGSRPTAAVVNPANAVCLTQPSYEPHFPLTKITV
jgi:hypothetical protein